MVVQEIKQKRQDPFSCARISSTATEWQRLQLGLLNSYHIRAFVGGTRGVYGDKNYSAGCNLPIEGEVTAPHFASDTYFLQLELTMRIGE